MIDGFIEVLTGVGRNSRSVTFPYKDREASEVVTWVPQVSGATLDTPLEPRLNSQNIPEDRCVGFWSGTNAEGKQATIRVWITDPD